MFWIRGALICLGALSSVAAPGPDSWKCPEINEEPVVECSCDMPHTLRCSGDRSALEAIGKTLRSRNTASVSLLDCTVQNVTSLPGKLLEGVALHGLVISSGEIKEVHPSAFQGLISPLQALGLPNNQLPSVPTQALKSLPELDRLDLSGNKLKNLDSDTFKGLYNLSFVDLSNNLLAKVGPNSFTKLPQLRTLRLRGNRLTTVSRLEPLFTLEELDLSTNAFVGPLDSHTFPKMPSLRDLQLSHNSFSSIKMGCLQGLGNLTSLSLHHNQIDVIEDHAFIYLSGLVNLDLSHNMIVAVSGASLAHLPRVTDLDLRHNFLRALTADLVVPLKSLQSLRLDDNDMSIVASDALKIGTVLKRLTLLDFSRCKVHYTRIGGSYRDFFEIADEKRDNGALLDFHFAVLAPSDAHILLAPSSTLNRSDPAYEIVLGAGGNMFSDIRRAQKAAVKKSVMLQGLLSSLDVRSFWLHMSKDGLIEVGREGEELAFISWQDPDPLPLKYFSFGTWPGVEAKWFFDCPREDHITSDSKMVEPHLTGLEQLRKDLLTSYDPYVRPVQDPYDLTVVSMKLDIDYLSLDERKSSLEVKGTARLEWKDEKLLWDPDQYENITRMHLVGKQIWQPDLVLYNALDSRGRDILYESITVASFDGSVTWNPSTTLQAWCESEEIEHWPEDVHRCEILLGFWSDFNYLQLEFKDDESDVLGQNFKTEWNVLEVLTVSNFGLNYSSVDGPVPAEIPFLKLIFKLKRSSSVYGTVFFSPFLVIAMSMLAMFWVSPFGYLKISLGCLQLLLITLVLINLAEFVPVHPEKLPYLVLLYSSSYFASLGCISLSVVVINISRRRRRTPVPHFAWKILTSSCVSKLLCLSKVKISHSYGKLDDVTIAKMDESVQNTWILLGSAVDRIGFLCYLGIIAYAITQRY